MDIYDFITQQGHYADKHAGAGQHNHALIKSVSGVLQEIEDLHEIMLETTVLGVPEALQGAWISVAFLAFDAARRMGATQEDIEICMQDALEAVRLASQAAEDATNTLNSITLKGNT